MLSSKNIDKIKRTYYIETKYNSSQLTKASNNFQLKKILEVLSYGQIIIEMNTGTIENKKVNQFALQFLLGLFV